MLKKNRQKGKISAKFKQTRKLLQPPPVTHMHTNKTLKKFETKNKPKINPLLCTQLLGPSVLSVVQ